MIKLFRKIRYNLMETGKTTKYFKYAIGEIILVVIGILIALQINNWNEERKSIRQEQLVLSQILSDFEANLEQLDQKIDVRFQMMMSSKKILALIDNRNLRDIDTLDNYIATCMAYTTYDPIEINLDKSGELSLISDPLLKKALNNWSSEINDVIEDEYNWKDYRNKNFIPFLLKHYQLRSLRNKAFKSNALGNFSLKRSTASEGYMDNDIGFSKHPVNMHQLLDNPDFEDHISRCYSINSWTNSEAKILRKRLVDITDMIRRNLK